MAHELNSNSDKEFNNEKGSKIGNLASTLDWKPHGLHDLGPYKIFWVDKEPELKVKSILGKDKWITKKNK